MSNSPVYGFNNQFGIALPDCSSSSWLVARWVAGGWYLHTYQISE